MVCKSQKLTNLTIEHRKHIKCWKWDILLLMATFLKKVSTGFCLPLCSIPSSPTSVNTWELRTWVPGPLGEECCPILAWYRFLAAQQSWVLFVIFCMSYYTKCFHLVKALDCQQASRAPRLLYYKAVLS